MKQLIDVFAEGGATAFISGKGVPSKKVIDMFHERNMLVGSIAGKLTHATRAAELGVDFIVVQGSEVSADGQHQDVFTDQACSKGGGHTGEVFTSVLLPQVVDAVGDRIPVVAAGGYYDGRGLASALCYGAQAIWVGTRFMLTPEAHTTPKYKERLLRASSDDTTVTKCFTGARLRVLRCEYTEKYRQDPSLLEPSSAQIAARAWKDGCWVLESGLPGDYIESNQAYVVGQNIGAIDTLLPAKTVVEEMVTTCCKVLTRAQSKLVKNGKIHSRLCDLLGVETCIMSAGMGGIAGKDMTAAVSRAGGFGTFGSALDVANKGPAELTEELLSIKAACEGKPFGVDILIHGANGGVMSQLIDVFAKGGATAFISGKGNPSPKVVSQFHDKGMKVASICGKLSHARQACEAGVDFVIVQGAEGGGHTGEVALGVLLPQVVDEVAGRIPVVAAGGIYDGRGIASALCYGAEGVWLGTKFMMSPESCTSDKYKDKLLACNSDDTIVTKAYTGSTLRVVRNPYVMKYDADPSLLEASSALIARRAWNDNVWKLHSGAGVGGPDEYDESNQALVVGQNIGAIKSLQPCEVIVQELNDLCVATLEKCASLVSPVSSKL